MIKSLVHLRYKIILLIIKLLQIIAQIYKVSSFFAIHQLVLHQKLLYKFSILSHCIIFVIFSSTIFINLFNLVMILKRLFNISLLTKNSHSNLRHRFLFSSKENANQQDQPQQQVNQQIVNIQQGQQIQQAIQSAAPQDYRKGKRKFKDNKQNRSEQKNDYWQLHQQKIIDKFMLYKTPQIDMNSLVASLQSAKNQEQLNNQLKQTMQKMQRQKFKALQDYERKINLTPSLLLENRLKLGQLQNKKKIGKFSINDLLSSQNIKQVRQLFQSRYESFTEKQLTKQIVKQVIQNPHKNFLLNVLYQRLQIGQNDAQNISNNDLNTLVQSVSSGQYSQVNPLKFYWYLNKLNPKSADQIPKLLMKQLNKLTISGKNASKQLRSFTYFYLGQSMSCNIISKILSTAQNLQEVFGLWVYTLIIVSRIRKLSDLNLSKTQVNFNDVISLQKANQRFNSFILIQLPKIFFNNSNSQLYETYRSSIRHYNKNQRDLENINVGEFQQQFGFNVVNRKNVKIQYKFQADPQVLQFHVFQTLRNQNKQIKAQSPQFKMVQNSIKGNYDQVLNFYIKMFGNHEILSQEVDRLKIQAQNQFDDKNSRALYVLKEIYKQIVNTNIHNRYNLTNEILEGFFGSTSNNKSNRYESRHSKQIRKPLFGQRTKKQNEQQKELSNNEDQNSQAKQKNQTDRNQSAKSQLQNQSKHTNTRRSNKEHKFNKDSKSNKSIFTKKTSNEFSSMKQKFQNQEGKPTKQQSNKHYEDYLKVVKQTTSQKTQEVSPKKQIPIFNFRNCQNIQQIGRQFRKNMSKINQNNIKDVITYYSNIPIVGNISVLLKYYFFNGTTDSKINQKLTVQFQSSSGQVSKDYGKYLKGCQFRFSLPKQVYLQLLDDQLKTFKRQNFKKIIAHMALFNKEIDQQIINKICLICSKQKIGLTLLQIINLLIARQIKISYESLKKIASSVQNFKDMQSDLLQIVKKYCQKSNIQIQTKLFEPYISNLTFSENYQSLSNFFDTLRQQLKIKQYKIDPKLSPEQNLKAEKAYKLKQAQRTNHELFEMVRIVANSFKSKTTIPNFVIELYELYLGRKANQMKSPEYAVGLILYSRNQEKFIEILEKLKKDPQENNIFVLEAAQKALILFGKSLKGQIQKILRALLFEKQHDLNQNHLKNFGYIFKDLDSPGAYSEYLQYILKKQPQSNIEIKNLYYKVFNMTTDDNAKNQISGLLDFIFNPNRQKQRAQYKKVKIEQERKQKILKNINAKVQQKPQSQSQKTKQQQNTNQNDKKVQEKQKKKSKKQLKKAAKSQQKVSDDKNKVQQKSLQKQKKGTPLKRGYQKLDKVLLKNLNKVSQSLSYDQNNRIVYHQKLWKRDQRKSAVNQFIQSFLNRYELLPEQDQVTKQSKNKKSKNKQPAKDTKKKGQKQVAKKK